MVRRYLFPGIQLIDPLRQRHVGGLAAVGRVPDHALRVHEIDAVGGESGVLVGLPVRVFVAKAGLEDGGVEVEEVQEVAEGPGLLVVRVGEGVQEGLRGGLGGHEHGAQGEGVAAVRVVQRLQKWT